MCIAALSTSQRRPRRLTAHCRFAIRLVAGDAKASANIGLITYVIVILERVATAATLQSNVVISGAIPKA